MKVKKLLEALNKVDPELDIWGFDGETCQAYPRSQCGVVTKISEYFNDILEYKVWDISENLYPEDKPENETDVFMIY